MPEPPIDTAESYPFETSAIATETQFYDMSRTWSGDGISDEPHGVNSGVLIVDSGNRQVIVAAYYAHVGGAVANQPTEVVIDMPAASSVDRLDRIVTRRDPAADKCVLDVLQGTPGSGTPPSVTQDRTGIWELSHGVVPVNADASLGSTRLERVLIGPGIRYGLSTYRPPDARTGELFYEYDTDRTVQLVTIEGPWRVVLEDTGWTEVPPNTWGVQAAGRPLRVRRMGATVILAGNWQRVDAADWLETHTFTAVGQIPEGLRPSNAVEARLTNGDGIPLEAHVAPSGTVSLRSFGRLQAGRTVGFDMTWFVD